MVRTLNYTITEEYSGINIIGFLKGRFFPSKMITHLKHTDNSVMLNGCSVFVNTVLNTGDLLTINYTENEDSENIVPVNLSFSIVYEDEDIMVVDKPADMPVHPAINNFDNTLANGIAYYFSSKNQHFVFRCINRLDRNTSGLLIVAKHRLSAAILSGFMKTRQIHREYIALADGIFEKKSDTINLPIGRRGESIIERFVDFEHGEEAITNYKVIEEFPEHNPPCSLLSVTLDTGRTHQIRVHMSHIGHPLLGDGLYNKKPGSLPRQALHSHVIEFTHPITLEKMRFESDIDFFNL